MTSIRQKILHAVQAADAATMDEIAGATGLDKEVARANIKAARQGQLLGAQVDRATGKTDYSLTKQGVAWLKANESKGAGAPKAKAAAVSKMETPAAPAEPTAPVAPESASEQVSDLRNALEGAREQIADLQNELRARVEMNINAAAEVALHNDRREQAVRAYDLVAMHGNELLAELVHIDHALGLGVDDCTLESKLNAIADLKRRADASEEDALLRKLAQNDCGGNFIVLATHAGIDRFKTFTEYQDARTAAESAVMESAFAQVGKFFPIATAHRKIVAEWEDA